MDNYSQGRRSLVFSSASALVAFALVLTLGGCSGPRRGASDSEMRKTPPPGKVIVDAYLFDVKTKSKVGRRSMRMSVFFADSLASITGRGYLGKGVFRGVWRPDSSLFYFPMANEYFSGPLEGVLNSGCLDGSNLQEAFAVILSGDTSQLAKLPGLEIVLRDEKRLEVEFTLGDCPAPVKLNFDRRGDENFFALRKFSYESDDGAVKIKAERRTLKLRREYEKRKLQVQIPDDASVVTW